MNVTGALDSAEIMTIPSGTRTSEKDDTRRDKIITTRGGKTKPARMRNSKGKAFLLNMGVLSSIVLEDKDGRWGHIYVYWKSLPTALLVFATSIGRIVRSVRSEPI
jgi:hypothetical protein